MSRGHPDDFRKTIEELKKPSGIKNGKNWLDHGGEQAQKIDEILLTGATKQEIAQDLIQIGLSKRDIQTTMHRVQRHIDHLRKEEHKLPLKQDKNGVWRFDIEFQGENESNETLNTRNFKKKNYYPTKKDFEEACHVLKNFGQEIPVDTILDQIETALRITGIILSENWRAVTRKNIENIWSN
ncbi:MAG: hypothetical protein AB1585_04620 [Thermodesulfobacteriota bacterium]